jgi:YD repeat-containing protein
MDRLSKVTLNRVDMQDFVNTNEITLYEYDKRGLTTKEIGTTGLETLYAYDENGNLVQKTDADGYITVYAHEETSQPP